MRSPSRFEIEATLVVLTSASLGVVLSFATGQSFVAGWLLVLTSVAVVAEIYLGADSLRHARVADSQGIAVGAVALPCLAAAMLAGAGAEASANARSTEAAAVTLITSSALILATVVLSNGAGDRCVKDEDCGPEAKPRSRVALSSPWWARHLGIIGSGRPLRSIVAAACGATAAGVQLTSIAASRDVGFTSQQSALRTGIAFLATGLYCLIMEHLPGSFTAGEGAMVAQGLAAVLVNGALVAADHLVWGVLRRSSAGPEGPEEDDGGLAVAFVEGMLSAACVAALASAPSALALGRAHRAAAPLPLRHLLAIASVAAAVLLLALEPAVWAIRFTVSSRPRFFLTGYWAALLCVCVPLIWRVADDARAPKIVVRKLYHLLAAAIFAPGVVVDAPLLAVAAAVAFAALVALEIIRIGRIPPLGSRIHGFMSAFTDSRDEGVLLVSHFSLLLGMAFPVWLLVRHQPQMRGEAMAGILVLGVMDTAASLTGISFGRTPVHAHAKKTMEGLTGGILSTLAAWGCLMVVGAIPAGPVSAMEAARLVAATTAAGVMEAVTTQMDNLILPTYYLTLLMMIRPGSIGHHHYQA